MKKYILLSNLSLSVYSFGYSAGFLDDKRINSKKYQNLTPFKIALIAKELGLGGIEIPLDKYFANPVKDDLKGFINQMNKIGIKLIFDLENFTTEYLELIAPYIAEYGSKFIRVKISRFYGGNRHINSSYILDKKEFYKKIDESQEILKEYNLKILVENHQDIVANDILELINIYGENLIGVNWDIGNSFPTCETPNSFFRKLGKYIGNVHLKDYKLYSCFDGYIMSRCELGKGVIDFKEILDLFPTENIPLTIELGAFNSRVAEINNSNYWLHTDGISSDEKDIFIKYINEHSEKDGDWKSPWEIGVEPEFLSKLELTEVINSVNFIKQLLIK
jgi:sugar phosphate isomerase/epimerase